MNTTTQSPELTRFYREYLLWATTGAPNWKPFGTGVGLCHNLTLFRDYSKALTEELVKQLEYDDYPFGGEGLYTRERNANICQHNPARLAFVRAHCAPGWSIDFEYNAWRAVHDSYEGFTDDEGEWTVNGQCLDAPTLEALFTEIDELAAEKGLKA